MTCGQFNNISTSWGLICSGLKKMTSLWRNNVCQFYSYLMSFVSQWATSFWCSMMTAIQLSNKHVILTWRLASFWHQYDQVLPAGLPHIICKAFLSLEGANIVKFLSMYTLSFVWTLKPHFVGISTMLAEYIFTCFQYIFSAFYMPQISFKWHGELKVESIEQSA